MTNRVLTETLEITELARICPVAEPPTPSADPDVEALVNRARAAQRDIEAWSEARIEALLHALASAVAAHAYQLAVATVTETGWAMSVTRHSRTPSPARESARRWPAR